MAIDIEDLEIQISTSANSASRGLDRLCETLNRLSGLASAPTVLSGVADGLERMSGAVSSLSSTGVSAINSLVTALKKFNGIGDLSSIHGLGQELQDMGVAISYLTEADLSGLGELETSLSGLSNIGSLDGLKSAVEFFNKLPDIISNLNNVDLAPFTAKVQELANALQPLAERMQQIGTSFSQLPPEIQNATSALTQEANATDRAAASNQRASQSFTDVYHKVKAYLMGFMRLVNAVAGFIGKSNEYIEDLNLFTAALGKYADKAKDYSVAVSEALGIDPADWMRNQGVFMTLATGFGVAGDRAYTMSKNLTQLGYDISSFFNISVGEAMQKLQSGISGELEPLRRLGYDLSQVTLKATAMELGITKAFTKMSQAEKAQLRYYAIMTQVTTAQGDMARTLESPSNQLRVFKAQLTQTARAIGNVLIPAINAILPYVMAVVKAIRFLGEQLAGLFGFTLPEVDYSGITGASDAMDTVGTSADKATKKAKKLKDYIMGFDELNVINPDDSSSSGSGRPGVDPVPEDGRTSSYRSMTSWAGWSRRGSTV